MRLQGFTTARSIVRAVYFFATTAEMPQRSHVHGRIRRRRSVFNGSLSNHRGLCFLISWLGLTTIIALSTVRAAHAAPLVTYAEFRVAVVNMDRVLNESPSAKQRRSRLDAAAITTKENVGKRRTALKEQEKNLKSSKADEKSPEYAQFRSQVKEFNKLVAESEENLKKEFTKNNEELAAEVLRVVSAISKEKQLSLVMDGSQQHRGSVLFSDTNLDITSEVLKRLSQ